MRTSRKDILDVGIPWLAWPCIDFVEKKITPGMRVLEWGGGGSTLFFLRSGCTVVTLEDHPDWAARLKTYVARLPAPAAERWSCVQCPVVTPMDRQRYVEIVKDHAPLDLLLVDGPPGISRVDCVRSGMDCLKPGGMLVLDNAYDRTLEAVPQILRGWRHHVFWGLAFRAGADRTDVYFKP